MSRVVLIGLAATLCVLPLAGAPKKPALETLGRLLSTSDDPAVQRDVLRGMSDALAGRRTVPAPAGWAEVYRKLSASPDAEVREKVLALSVLFGDPQALLTLKRTAQDVKASKGARARAVEVLLDRGEAELPVLLRQLLDEPDLRRLAIRGLARYGEATTPQLLLSRYAKLPEAEKADAIATLTSRPGYALALLDAMEKKQVPRGDLTTFQARQLLALGDKKVAQRLNAVWGTIRPAGKDREKLLARYRALATPGALKKADRGNGRAVWAKSCASCHTLFGEGGKIGPDLTGAQRTSPEYILTKVLDPNAVVPRDFQVSRVVTTAGRVLMGVVKQETDKVLTLQTPTEEVRVRKSDIEERVQDKISLMPEGQLQQMTDAEVRDLLAYVGGAGQVRLPGSRSR